MDFVAQHQTQDGAAAGDGLEPGQGLGSVLLGRFEDGSLSIAAAWVIVPDQGESHCQALGDGQSGEALGDARMVGGIRELLPTLSIPLGYAEEGASISIKAVEPTPRSLVSLRGDVGDSPSRSPRT